MVQQFKTPRGDIVIVQGEMQIMAATQAGWQPVAPGQTEDEYSAPGLFILDRDEPGVDYTNNIISGVLKRRATTARFTIDPKTGRIINEQE